MSDPTDDALLNEGLHRYVRALDILQSFRKLLQERLRSAMASYRSEVFSPRGRSYKDYSDDRHARTVWVAQEGRFRAKKSPVYLELGLWWKGEEAAYYAAFTDADDEVIDFTYRGGRKDVAQRNTGRARWSSRAYLFKTPSPDPAATLEADVSILLDELMASFR